MFARKKSCAGLLPGAQLTSRGMEIVLVDFSMQLLLGFRI